MKARRRFGAAVAVASLAAFAAGDTGQSSFADKPCLSYSSFRGRELRWGNAPLDDFGPVPVRFDLSGVRPLPPVPKPGVHPRILCSPAELPDIRRRLKETRCGRQIWRNILSWTHGMKATYDDKADYAQPDLWKGGFGGLHGPVPLYRLGSGGWKSERYRRLADGDETAEAGFFWNVFPLEAFRCWIEDDKAGAETLARAGRGGEREMIRNAALLAVLLGSGGILAGQGDAFDQRRRLFLDAVWKDYQEHADRPSAKQAFFRAEALFELGKLEEGRRLVHRGLDQLVPGNKENRWIHGGNSGFVAWPGMDCYVRYERCLDEALKERYRKIYTGAVFYRRLSTSNHKIMAAVTRYLATQVWGPDAFRPDPFFEGKEDDGSRFERSDPTGEKYVRSVIAETVRDGPGEYASRPYGAENVLPLLTLAEAAGDPGIRERALLAYEYSLIQLAPAYLRGHLATFSPRSYPDVETQQPWGIAALAWAYFGGVPPATLHDPWALRAATATYRLPGILQAAGTDRSRPYVYRSHVNRWALYHYVNRTYVLFSRSPKAETRQFMGQSYPCGVMWEEPDPARGAHLWITNPAADDNSGDAGNRPTGIHTHGVTKHEQQVQHQDASLSVFDIPADFRNPYVLGYVPGGFRAVVNDSRASRRIFLHYGSVLVAVTSAHPFEWDPASGIRAPASKPREGDSEFRVRASRTAVSLETALPGEFPGNAPQEQLDKFRQAVVERSKIEFRGEGKAAGRYTDRFGNTLECVFDGPDAVNGQAVDYAAWPALENPWMSRRRGDPLTVTGGGVVRTYDFAAWKVAETGR